MNNDVFGRFKYLILIHIKNTQITFLCYSSNLCKSPYF